MRNNFFFLRCKAIFYVVRDRILFLVPGAWMIIFFFLPFLIVFKVSLSQAIIATPPYTPIMGFSDFFSKIGALNFDNYLFLFEEPLYRDALFSSFCIAFFATFFTLFVAYPIAYSMVCAPAWLQPILFMLIVLPFWTSFLIRVYAWTGILRPEGLMNSFLLWTGLIKEPLIILNSNAAVVTGIVYSYLPFMILPLYACLKKIDLKLIDAASDLGCTPLQAFWKITFPLSLPGVVAGSVLVFIPSVGEFVIPDLLGGNHTLMIGKILWNEFFFNRDWPVSSAFSVVLLFFLFIPIILFQSIYSHNRRKQR